MHLVAIGGSDAGISAALRARELDPTADVTVVVADAYPNFSICGIPYYISGEVTHWRNLAHRTHADLEATGMQLRLDTLRHRDRRRRAAPRGPRPARRHRTGSTTTSSSSAPAPSRSGRPSTASTSSARTTACTCCTPWATPSPSPTPWTRSSPKHRADRRRRIRRPGDGRRTHRPRHPRHPGRDAARGPAHRRPRTRRPRPRRTRPDTASTSTPDSPSPASPAPPSGPARLHVDGTGPDSAAARLGRRPGARRGRRAPRHRPARRRRRADRPARRRVVDADHGHRAAARLGRRRLRRHPPPTARRHLPAARHHRAQAGPRRRRERPRRPSARFAGSLGTQVVKVFDLVAARTGLRDHEATAAGYTPRHHAPRRPTTTRPTTPARHPITIRITGDATSGRLLGAQLVGARGTETAKRVDTYATALFHGMTVDATHELDLSYTPPLGSPWDAVQMAAQTGPDTPRPPNASCRPGTDWTTRRAAAHPPRPFRLTKDEWDVVGPCDLRSAQAGGADRLTRPVNIPGLGRLAGAFCNWPPGAVDRALRLGRRRPTDGGARPWQRVTRRLSCRGTPDVTPVDSEHRIDPSSQTSQGPTSSSVALACCLYIGCGVSGELGHASKPCPGGVGVRSRPCWSRGCGPRRCRRGWLGGPGSCCWPRTGLGRTRSWTGPGRRGRRSRPGGTGTWLRVWPVWATDRRGGGHRRSIRSMSSTPPCRRRRRSWGSLTGRAGSWVRGWGSRTSQWPRSGSGGVSSRSSRRRSSSPPTRSWRPRSVTWSAFTWTPRRRPWCCRSMRKARSRPWTGPRRSCRCDRTCPRVDLRLRPARHHHPVRRPGHRDREGHPDLPPAAPLR